MPTNGNLLKVSSALVQTTGCLLRACSALGQTTGELLSACLAVNMEAGGLDFFVVIWGGRAPKGENKSFVFKYGRAELRTGYKHQN